MKLATTISAGAFIFFSAFILKNKEAREQAQTLYTTKWSLKKIHTDSTMEEVTGKAFIKFDAEKKSAGGNGSCNTFGGTLDVSGNTISIKNIFSTKMFCEGIQQTENEYLTRLGQVNRYYIKGKTLTLYKEETLLLEFTGE